ncbi:uncharacterized protein LOC109515049 [Hippocampus comes]|uniref:uncharacterized protein LOC109515049 n=1 Tax=Hippocampus comes TaxID=109280 RepID=UPI00094E5F85|nr:PREDICTED: uncharacterized protein LOC109515049 [Hippocampus comes]XP_019724173.1 PREDICTED: uncharacterized protein LOC109515049 [Hippocampus comes]
MSSSLRDRSTHSNNDDSPIEPKYLRCSNLNMPLLATEFFKSELQLYLDGLTSETWDLIEYGHFDCNAFMVLLKMWQSILYKISQEVLSVVLPQVEEHAQILVNGCDSPQQALNYSCVTVDDIHACIWDSLLLALKDTINAGEIRSPCGDHLLELVAAKVSKTVNSALSEMSSQLDSAPHLDVPHQVSEIGEIALQSISVLRDCLENMRMAGRYGIEEDCAGSESSEDATNILVAPLPTPVQTCEKVSTHLHAQTPTEVHIKTGNTCLHPPAETWTKKENIFCTVFLWKLMDHIAASNAKSVLEMDIDWMLAQLKSTVVETRPNHPQNIGDFHIDIYKDLCQEFGSKERLYFSMVCCQLVFVEALARALKNHLQAPKKKDFFTVVKAFFRKRTAKVSLACEHGRVRLLASTNTRKL